MPTVQYLLNTVDTTYRNSYSSAQKIEWMDTIQKQIFQTVRHEAVPYTFQTVAGFSYYPLPDDCDPMGIKEVTIETKSGSNQYRQLRFVSIMSNEVLSEHDEFYTIEGNQNLYINPLPNEKTEGRNVYLYYNMKPADLTNPNQTPDLEENFHELLVLGCLERIARARGEYDDKNMFSMDFEKLFKRYKDMYDQPFPVYVQPTDNMPRNHGKVHVKGRQSYPYGLLPSQYL